MGSWRAWLTTWTKVHAGQRQESAKDMMPSSSMLYLVAVLARPCHRREGVHGPCMHGQCMVSAWSVHGQCMVSAWWRGEVETRGSVYRHRVG